MADNIAIYGFRPYVGRYSSDFPVVEKFTATGYQAAPGAVNVDLNIGDPVIRVSDGSIAIAVAGATNPVYGIVMGVPSIWDASLGAMRPSDKVPGATAWSVISRQPRITVCRVQGMLWEVDVDDAVTATTLAGYQAFIGENVNIIYSASATTGRASPKVDISLHATTNTFQCNIVDVSPSVNNVDYSGANVKLIVQFNLPDENPPLILGV
jgi:hypothetical protein